MTSADRINGLMEYQLRAKSPLAAYLIWWFLGMFGGHNFYLGRTTQAIWQLVLTLLIITSPIVAVWALVDVFFIGRWLRVNNWPIAADIRQRLGGDALPPSILGQ